MGANKSVAAVSWQPGRDRVRVVARG